MVKEKRLKKSGGMFVKRNRMHSWSKERAVAEKHLVIVGPTADEELRRDSKEKISEIGWADEERDCWSFFRLIFAYTCASIVS